MGEELNLHQIWLGTRREFFAGGSKFYDCDVTSRDTIRNSVDVFKRTSNKDEVLLVDTENLYYDNFGVFLSVLEYKYLQGQIWFYGYRVLSAYPLSIRSRCVILGRRLNVESESVKDFLEAHNAEQFKEEFSYLHIYPPLFIWDMLSSRERFIAFMYNLEHSSRENFHILFNQFVEMGEPKEEEKEKEKAEGNCFVYLFYEWLKAKEQNVIFTAKELEVCKFLRTGKFEKHLNTFLGTDIVMEKYLFPFLISYKMAQVLG